MLWDDDADDDDGAVIVAAEAVAVVVSVLVLVGLDEDDVCRFLFTILETATGYPLFVVEGGGSGRGGRGERRKRRPNTAIGQGVKRPHTKDEVEAHGVILTFK